MLISGYTEAELADLTGFLQQRQAIRRHSQLQFGDWYHRAGPISLNFPLDRVSRNRHTASYITNTATGVSGFSLHSQALLTAFWQSNQTAAPQHALNDVTFKLTELVKMFFDTACLRTKLTDEYEAPNFLERIVRHEAGVRDPVTGVTIMAPDAMVTRFTADLWKVAQDGGLSLTNTEIAKTLTAFAMQMYYEDTANATNPSKQLFTAVTGGIQFDRADVATTLKQALGL